MNRLNNKKLISIILIGLITITSAESTYAVKAAEAGVQQTDATLTFKNDKTRPTPPVDPTNPSQPGGNPANPGDPTNPGTGAGGPLSIDYAPNFDFGVGQVSSQLTTYTLSSAVYSDGKTRPVQNPFVQVSDNRGSDEGWNLSASISDFKNSQGSTIQTLKGASVSIQSKDGNKAIAGYGNTSVAPDAVSEKIDLTSAPKNLINAPAKTGRGAWIQRYDPSKVTLTVPGGSALVDTVYTAKITWTLSASPVN